MSDLAKEREKTLASIIVADPHPQCVSGGAGAARWPRMAAGGGRGDR